MTDDFLRLARKITIMEKWSTRIYSHDFKHKPRVNNTATANEPRTEADRGILSKADGTFDCTINDVFPSDDKDVTGGASGGTVVNDSTIKVVLGDSRVFRVGSVSLSCA